MLRLPGTTLALRQLVSRCQVVECQVVIALIRLPPPPDGTHLHPITKEYAIKCGYSVSDLPSPGHVELRASYFSCHTENQVRTETWSGGGGPTSDDDLGVSG